jgi:hypothetical protein
MTCVYGKLYRANIAVRNRGTTALKCLTSVPPALRGVVEFLPDMFYLQVQMRCHFCASFVLCRVVLVRRRCGRWYVFCQACRSHMLLSAWCSRHLS